MDLRVAGRIATVPGYRLDLGAPDDPHAPHAWEGPITVTATSGRVCHVSDAVAIIDRPLVLVGGRLLYVDTYSGSEGRVFVVDLATCAIRWRSRLTTLGNDFHDDTLFLDGSVPYRIGTDGLPVVWHVALPAHPRWQELHPTSASTRVAGTAIDLGTDFSGGSSRRWSGPIVVTAPDGTACAVREDDEIDGIDAPLRLLGGRLLYYATAIGDRHRFHVVDITDCRTLWSSFSYAGPARLTDHALILENGDLVLGIDAGGLPTR